ncbi:MAG: pitrilysin family protein [bacterium]|nr:pitrilysin family protein [bacterium]
MEMCKTLYFGRQPIRIEVDTLEKSGVVVASARDRTARKVSLRLGVRHGWETRKGSGVRHLIEHMIFKGSKSVKNRELVEAIEFDGGNLCAETEREFTVYEVLAPSWISAKKHFSAFADVFLNPSFEGLEKERGVVRVEKKSEFIDDPQGYVQSVVHELLFPDSAMGLPIHGTLENLSRLTKEDLARVHQKYYRNPQRLIIAGSGLVRHEELMELTRHVFGSLRGPRPPAYLGPESVRKLGRQAHGVERQKESSHLLVGFNISPILGSPNDQAAFLLLVSLLSNGMSSHLHQALREERGISYTVEAACEFAKSYALALFEADCDRPEDLDEAERIIRNEIELLQKRRVASRKIRGHRRRLRIEIRDNIDDPSKLSEELFRQVFFGKPEKLYASYHDLRRVTAHDVQRVSKYLDLANYAVVRIEGTKPLDASSAIPSVTTL